MPKSALGPYPLGDIGVIGCKISHRQPILSPITLWVWPICWVTGQLITGRPPSQGNGKTADLYQACLIFHCKLVARRSGTEGPSGYGPLRHIVGSEYPPPWFCRWSPGGVQVGTTCTQVSFYCYHDSPRSLTHNATLHFSPLHNKYM